MKFYANLHTHSNHSDGRFTPTQMAETAKEEGYGAVAITDHDTITAYPELKQACDKIGMECIPGTEFSTAMHPVFESDFHLVGFHYDPEYPAMKEYLRQLSENEQHITKTLFDEGIERGTLAGVTWEEVLEHNKGITWLCNEHVFKTMKDKGLLTDDDYQEFFKPNFSRSWLRVKHIYEFKLLDDMVDLIHDAGGIAILAHPTKDNVKHYDGILKTGIDGIEVWQPGTGIEEIFDITHEFALKNKLYISGGSDHSGICSGLLKKGEVSKYPPCSIGTTKQYFEEIRDRQLYR